MCNQDLRELSWWFQQLRWSWHNIDPRSWAVERLKAALMIIDQAIETDPWRTADPTGTNDRVRRNRDDFVDVQDGFRGVIEALQKLKEPTPHQVRTVLQLHIGMLNGLTRWNAPGDPSVARQAAKDALVYVQALKREFVLELPSG